MWNCKTSGHDEIPIVAVKNLSHLGYEYLTRVYNGCLRDGYYPKDWKISRTIAVPKPGKDPNDRKSYRPISLLYTYSKVFEKIITKRVNFTITNSKIISNMDTVQNTQQFTHSYYSKAALKRDSKTIKLLEFSLSKKAFDRSWHDGLIYKLIK